MRPPLLVLVAALVLQGCGAGKPRLKPAVFSSDATRVCRSAQTDSRALQRPAQPGDVPLFLRRAARVLRSAVTRFDALRPPASLDVRWRRQTALLHRQLAIVVGLAHSVHDGKGDAVAAVLRFERRLRAQRAATDAGWRALGLPGCVAG